MDRMADNMAEMWIRMVKMRAKPAMWPSFSVVVKNSEVCRSDREFVDVVEETALPFKRAPETGHSF